MVYSVSCMYLLYPLQAVVWSNSNAEHSDSGDHVTRWKAFSVPLELDDSITAVDFAPVSLSTGR